MPTIDRTSLPEIINAGRDIVEIDGPSKLTMWAVAKQVGVRAPSLYKRVRGRDALLDLIAEATANDLADLLEASDGSLAEIGRAFRAFAQKHPEGLRLIFAANSALDAMARASGPVLYSTTAIVGLDAAPDAARLVTAWATGFVNMELAGSFHFDSDLNEAFEYGLERIVAGLQPG